MAEFQGVFKRIEKKYMLTNKQYMLLIERLRLHMEMDSYGLHTINNIYYDTDDYKLIRSSIEKPIYKEKLRLRSYGIAANDSQVFLEIKKKFDGVVYKRREAMTLEEANLYVDRGVKPAKCSQIINEIDWFLKIYKLSPKAYVAYDRIALFGKENSEVRVTFDSNIRCRDYELDLSYGPYGEQILEKNHILMEVKIPQAMPLWMVRIFDELGIYSTSFSKYGTYYKKYLMEDFLDYVSLDIKDIEYRDEIGGIICA